jgi:hypothetical protein
MKPHFCFSMPLGPIFRPDLCLWKFLAWIFRLAVGKRKRAFRAKMPSLAREFHDRDSTITTCPDLEPLRMRAAQVADVDACEYRESVVDISPCPWHTRWAVEVPFCWTGGLCSLTTDTMCQNLFETIGVFERQWSE